MDEEVKEQINYINKEVTPILAEKLADIDYTPVIIYFAGLLKTLMDEYPNKDFNKTIIKFITDGDEYVSL